MMTIQVNGWVSRRMTSTVSDSESTESKCFGCSQTVCPSGQVVLRSGPGFQAAKNVGDIEYGIPGVKYSSRGGREGVSDE